MNTMVEVENKYNILKNAEGQLLIAIKARMGGSERPKILYDGQEHALLYRSVDQTVILDYIHPQVREAFMNIKDVLVVELRDEDIVREYVVPVRRVTKLPVIGDLTTAAMDVLDSAE
ncbi:MAG: hypothetical protein EOM53_02155 [Alphaproteobacteria bacterium]|nr:hypothetical protein [Alphaproteobacteria bacterium]NCB49468.1 hypothetical protein [Alphaproteobacteria bacterium]